MEPIADCFSLRSWLLTVAETRGADRLRILRQALSFLPGSYKLWMILLKGLVAKAKQRAYEDNKHSTAATTAFEEAIVFTFRMPSVWLLYMSWLADLGQLSPLRQCLNKALRSLPVTQHVLVWDHWSSLNLPWPSESRSSVMGRRLMFDPHKRVGHAKALLTEGDARAAVLQLMVALDEEAKSGKKVTAEDTWGLLSSALAELPEAGSLPVGRILRSGIHRRPAQTGVLWCTLAELAVKSGAFESARDIYEEAVASVSSVRDFAQVYDAYVKFEEALLAAGAETGVAGGVKAQQAGDSGPEVASPWLGLLPINALAETVEDEDLRFARLEQLIDRQPLLLSSVLLRQNPHNVHEWQRRASTFMKLGADARVVETYADAIKTVDTRHAVGKPHTLWTSFAQFYEAKGQLDEARAVLRHGTIAAFPTPEPTVTLWCSWVEMELRHGNVPEALRVVHAAVQPKRGAGAGRDVSAAARLWALALDLDIAFAPQATAIATFHAASACKAVTVAMVLTMASHLTRTGSLEEAFRVYQAGLALFRWPVSADIWCAYIRDFTERYGGAKLERARDLFESALSDCPPSKSAPLLRLYASFEERHGSLRRAMALLDNAGEVVPPQDRYVVYAVYLAKAAEYYGDLKCRPVYEKALQNCTPEACKILARRFAALETQLGELDRARAALRFGAQFADPRTEEKYWGGWAEWEVTHGNEESYRDMLRVKRSYALAAPQAAAVKLTERINAVPASGTEGAKKA